jgi:hypothetical protein
MDEFKIVRTLAGPASEELIQGKWQVGNSWIDKMILDSICREEEI